MLALSGLVTITGIVTIPLTAGVSAVPAAAGLVVWARMVGLSAKAENRARRLALRERLGYK